MEQGTNPASLNWRITHTSDPELEDVLRHRNTVNISLFSKVFLQHAKLY